jgi:hypothetical protein
LPGLSPNSPRRPSCTTTTHYATAVSDLPADRAPISVGDIDLPVTQPIDITHLMRIPAHTVPQSSVPDAAPLDPPAGPEGQSPAELSRAIQRWYSDGGAPATPRTDGLS